MTIRIAFIVGDLGFGGATTLLLNLAKGLAKEGIPIRIDSLKKENAFPEEFAALGPCVFFEDETALIFEDRVSAIRRNLASFEPTVVVGWMGSSSYEVLRYIPEGVLRLAVIHCDHEIFYNSLRPYTAVLDGVVAVSRTIRDTMAGMASFQKIPVQYLPNGVSVPLEPPVALSPDERRFASSILGDWRTGKSACAFSRGY